MNISSVAKTTAIPSSLNQSNRTSEPIPSSTQSDSVSISPEAFAASSAAVGSQSPSLGVSAGSQIKLQSTE